MLKKTGQMKFPPREGEEELQSPLIQAKGSMWGRMLSRMNRE